MESDKKELTFMKTDFLIFQVSHLVKVQMWLVHLRFSLRCCSLLSNTTDILSHHVTHLFFSQRRYPFPVLISSQKIFGKTTFSDD